MPHMRHARAHAMFAMHVSSTLNACMATATPPSSPPPFATLFPICHVWARTHVCVDKVICAWGVESDGGVHCSPSAPQKFSSLRSPIGASATASPSSSATAAAAAAVGVNGRRAGCDAAAAATTARFGPAPPSGAAVATRAREALAVGGGTQ
eukprot:358332-Chlamydomonas_euryale.AAC.2